MSEILDELKQEVIDTYNQYYIEGFKQDDISIIDQIVEYPLTYIKDGKVTTLDKYPVNPAELKRELQWDHSKDWKFEVAGINETSANVFASATRCRKDGSVIEYVRAFYGFKKVDGQWKMHVLADIVS